MTFDRVIDYHWVFDDPEDMVVFCSLLFSLDRAGTEDVLQAIREHQGYRVEDGRCLMNWALRFITGVKA